MPVPVIERMRLAQGWMAAVVFDGQALTSPVSFLCMLEEKGCAFLAMGSSIDHH
jgi:hypothetical protein